MQFVYVEGAVFLVNHGIHCRVLELRDPVIASEYPHVDQGRPAYVSIEHDLVSQGTRTDVDKQQT